MKTASVQAALFGAGHVVDLINRETLVPATSALEVDFPAVMVSAVAEHESWRKEIHRPATHTHKWWAQRLGSVFRAIICSAVSADAAAAETAYAQGLDLSGTVVFDPFAGSGTTLVEAAKLGATVVGRDINPVATLVQRQALQRWDRHELERAYREVESVCREEIDRVHRTELGETVLYYFWVAHAACPECAVPVRLFSSPVFARHTYPKRFPQAQVVCASCLDIQSAPYDFDEVECGNGHLITQAGAVAGPAMTCPNGHRSRVLEGLGSKPPGHEMYAKLILDSAGRKRYEPVTAYDLGLYQEAESRLRAMNGRIVKPRGRLEDGHNTRQAMRWGYVLWEQFFNARQLYSLGLLAAAIRDLDTDPAEREALAALFSGTLEFNNLFCSFKGEGTGAVRHMFSHHVLKPERTPLEAHPWGTPASSGSFSTLYRSRLLRAGEYKGVPGDLVRSRSGQVERLVGISRPLELELAGSWEERETGGASKACVATGDSAATDLPNESVDLVVTDPPYMDNVQYSELADFFHAWLRGIRPHKDYPAELASTRRPGEVQSTSALGFEEAIAGVWAECRRVLRPGGLVAFTFHQARLQGWVALCSALRSGGLRITGIQPVKAEMTSSITKSGAREPNSLDSVVVCRKPGDAVPFLSTVEEAKAKAVKSLTDLKDGGISFGVGDARSVARGCVMSMLTNPIDDALAMRLPVEADRIAEEVIAELGLPWTG